jgi:hypothetical protein
LGLNNLPADQVRRRRRIRVIRGRPLPAALASPDPDDIEEPPASPRPASDGGAAAVDRDHRALNRAGRIGAQEQNRVGDLLWRCHPAGRRITRIRRCAIARSFGMFDAYL